LAQVFLKARLKSASLEALLDLLANLEPRLWLKNSVFDKIEKVSERYNFPSQGKLWPQLGSKLS